MARKRKTKQETHDVLIGIVNSFNFNDKEFEEGLSGHPLIGRVYQIVRDDVYGYRLHIGRDNNESNLEGIILGPTLSGTFEDRWSYDISIITENNILDFNITDEDAAKVQHWFDTKNSELIELLKKPVTLVQTIAEVENPELDPMATVKVFIDSIEERNGKFAEHINFIMFKDQALFNEVCDFAEYLTTTYSDKYEGGARINFGKQFLLSSNSPDTAIFNALKYLQRYCTTGFEKSNNKKDLYKAMHYILFELQRTKNHE